MHVILLIPVLYLVAVVQTSLVDLIQVGRVAPDLFALAAVAWLLTVPGPRSFLVAGLIGLVEDLVSPGGLGLGMACFLGVGYGVTRLRAKFPLDHAVLKVLIVAAAVTVLALLLSIGQWLFGEAAFTRRTLLERAAGVGVYTAAVSVPVWMVLGWCRGGEGRKRD